MANIHRLDAPPSLEAANQAQIDDLVRRNRTLEYTNNKLSEQLSTEAERSKEAILEIQKQWHEQENVWRGECEELLACYHIAQLRTALEVETERANVLNEQKALRREKVLRLQRDFRITMFHAKERELEERIAELEEETERMATERKELGLVLRKKLAELITQLRLKDGEIADLHSERDVIEKDISKIREENAHLQASLASTSSRLERINLQFEGAQTSRSELESLNDELKRKNHDLQRQLDKWQRLETKGDVELDALRKRKIELEVEVKELQNRLDKLADERSKALEKERKRLEHLKTTALEWKEVAESNQRDLDDTQKELTTLQKRLEQLKAEPGNTSVDQPPKRANSTPKSKKIAPTTDAEAEPEVVGRSKPPTRRKKGTASESETDDAQEVQKPVKAARRRKKMSPVVEEESEVEEVDPPPKVKEGKGKAKATEKEITKPKAKSKLVEVSDVEEEPAPRRKRKAPADDSEAETEKPTKKAAKAATKTGNSRGGTVESPPKQRASGPTRDVSHVSDDITSLGADPVQKKKRKINIFAGAGSQSSQPVGFDFGLGGLNGGLNIPTTLSPVKESEGPIPNRTMSSVMSSVGGLIRNRMAGGR